MDSPLLILQDHPAKSCEDSCKAAPRTLASEFKLKISTFPREKGWDRVNNLYHYQGFWYYEHFLAGIMSAQEHFRPQPTDIFLTSCPKAGTTWLKALTFAIVTRARFDDSTSPLLKKLPHDCIPFIELDLSENSNNRDMEMPLVATHMPYTSLPTSVTNSGCKIVYICRDPRDAFVSYWFFKAKQLSPKNAEPLPLEEAFEMYCKGIINYGPCWDHVLGYWRASLEFPERILILKFEELKKDTTFYVKKLAEFIGYPFTKEETGVVQKIIDLCDFENLSNLEVNKNGEHRSGSGVNIKNNAFFRNGKVGDWENYLTAEMAARLNQIMEEKLKGSGFFTG
ncbi:hypothetical protein K2173_003973 [Erythroxylum novogranatense]|uniref:Sulfotransferase n=1 Tax=Erythroxylum novogranatense TaxID=1862640 RepID=A0AAV8SJE2_9ROSI|nr:hypothetical protein K2173_003973 [Erythroxylum novogranatense]